ncbi:MAG: hypothetical protein NC127_09020 [Muribaculum sp.]|nr:hypothetical protein [Muribaculum sp.]
MNRNFGLIILLIHFLLVNPGNALYGTNLSKNASDLRWTGLPSGLSDKLDISECYDMGSILGPVHFEENGIVFANNGKDVGAFIVDADTIKSEIYLSWGGLVKQFTKVACDFMILNNDSVKLIKFQFPPSLGDSGKVNLESTPTIFTHYKCPKNFKPNTKFVFKQKWLWRSEEDWKRWIKEYKK